MYFNKFEFTPLEIILLVMLIALALFAIAHNMVVAPRQRLMSPKPVVTSAMLRAIQIGFFALFVRLLYRLIKLSALDFSFVLVAASVFCGVVWLIDRYVLLPRRRLLAQEHHKAAEEAEVLPTTVEYAASFFPVIVIVLVIRSFLIEPFRIPSDSMMPTLLDGDFIFVNKYAYGLRLPVINDKIVSIGEPKRGDVIVFRLPSDPSVNYIKRLVGLPGDHIVVRENRVSINGTPVPLVWQGEYKESPNYMGARLGRETLGEVEHVVMAANDRYYTDFEAVVPPGRYYFMGDNRNNSLDSRFPQVGFVPEQNIVGRAVRIWMHWEWPKMPIWSRIGQAIE